MKYSHHSMNPFIKSILSIFLTAIILYSELSLAHLTSKAVIKGLNDPWSIAFIDEKLALITEKNGQLKLINIENAEITEVSLDNIRFEGESFAQKLFLKGQGGFLDIAPSPSFHHDQRIYFTYSRKTDRKSGATVLATAKLSPTNGISFKEAIKSSKEIKLVHWQELLVSNVSNTTGRHFGSRITFDKQGHIYFSIGDRGEREHGQDLSTLAAVIIRLNLDGSIPHDNPFINKQNAKPEIYSYGHRNPQGLIFSQSHNSLFSNEHGPRGGDEINRIFAGENYGWPVISHGKEYWGPIAVGEATTRTDIQAPIITYTPSIAPSSLHITQSQHYPSLKGKLLSSALAIPQISIISFDEYFTVKHEQRHFLDLNERIRDIGESHDGLLYFITDSGSVHRIIAQSNQHSHDK
jgi:glucose/arabinose dehydrogenase